MHASKYSIAGLRELVGGSSVWFLRYAKSITAIISATPGASTASLLVPTSLPECWGLQKSVARHSSGSLPPSSQRGLDLGWRQNGQHMVMKKRGRCGHRKQGRSTRYSNRSSQESPSVTLRVIQILHNQRLAETARLPGYLRRDEVVDGKADCNPTQNRIQLH